VLNTGCFQEDAPSIRSAAETVRVWDLTTGRPIGQKLVFPAPVNTLALTPDSRLLMGFGWEIAVLSRR
jgi:hypothetical protein